MEGFFYIAALGFIIMLVTGWWMVRAGKNHWKLVGALLLGIGFFGLLWFANL